MSKARIEPFDGTDDLDQQIFFVVDYNKEYWLKNCRLQD
jgi:hypothetical protein